MGMLGKCKAPNTCICNYDCCCIECPENDICNMQCADVDKYEEVENGREES